MRGRLWWPGVAVRATSRVKIIGLLVFPMVFWYFLVLFGIIGFFNVFLYFYWIIGFFNVFFVFLWGQPGQPPQATTGGLASMSPNNWFIGFFNVFLVFFSFFWYYWFFQCFWSVSVGVVRTAAPSHHMCPILEHTTYWVWIQEHTSLCEMRSQSNATGRFP